LDNFLNIGIFAHIDAGKTTFSERVLFEAGELSYPGSVEDGTTEMDRLPEEIKRGISIISSTTFFKYKFKKKNYYFNLIDTPGHLDFYSQVDSSLLAIDCAILLIDLTVGIRSQTELIAKEIVEKKIPVIVFLNKIDKVIEFNDIREDISKLFTIPLVDLCYKNLDKEILYSISEKEINESIELSYIEWSEQYTDKYFKSKDPKKVLLNGLLEGTEKLKHIPIFVGSSLKGNGIKEFLHFLCLFKPIQTDKMFDAIVFKKQIHPNLGYSIFLKLFHEIKKGQILYSRETSFEVTRMVSLVPDGLIELNEAHTNSIIVLPSMNLEQCNFQIGDCLWLHPPNESDNNVSPQKKQYPKDFIVYLEPEKEVDRVDLKKCIEDIVWEDQGLDFEVNLDTGQFVVKGMGELHLEVSLNRLKGLFKKPLHEREIGVIRYHLYLNEIKKDYYQHFAYDGSQKSYGLEVLIQSNPILQNKITFPFCTIELKKTLESCFYEFLSHGLDGRQIFGVQLEITNIIENDTINNHTLSMTKIALLTLLKNNISPNLNLIGPISEFEILVSQDNIGSVVNVLNKRKSKIFGMENLENGKSRLYGESNSENLLGIYSILRNITKGKINLTLRNFFTKDRFGYIE
jgi:small GTP-binding protein